MVPADTDDIRKEYEVLLNELSQFNPEMLDKQRVLAITKSDLIDEELMSMLEENLPDIPHVFISGVSGLGLTALKDLLWLELNKESNMINSSRNLESIVHKSKNLDLLKDELKVIDDGFEYVFDDLDIEDVDIEDIEGEDLEFDF